MKKTAKKLISLLLAVLLSFGAVPAEATDFEETAEIKDDELQQALFLIPEGHKEMDFLAPNTAQTAPATVTVEEAEARLNDLIEKFEGKFFTVDGNYCKASGIHATACDNCLMSNVIAADWVEELVGMGTLSAALCPTQYSYKGTQGSADGYQCFGFANFAHWYIFAGKNTDKVVSTLEFTGPMTYETIKNTLPGDVIRSNYYGGHSMIFISCDEEGYTVLDSNHTGNADGKSACIVKVHKVKYNSRYTVAVTGVQNYDRTVECEHQYSEEVTPPTCTERGYTTYTCTICGESYVDDYVDATGEHAFSEWTATKMPTEDSLGAEQRICSACGLIETREVEGVWQKYALAEHLLDLPEYVCCDTNLWAILPHESVHFTSGKKWGNTNTPVTSITIPVNPGDRIYATSFLAAGDNGGPHNGIRLTFFDAYGIAWTLDPGVTYNQWKKNDGYVEAPEGTIAVNIPLWGDSEDYEVYILNREHDYDNVTVEPTCTEEGYSGNICKGCGKGEKENIVNALGHDLDLFEAKAPACTEIGWNAYETCSRCDYTTYEEIPAAGHSYGEWTKIKAPSCDSEGQDKSVCETCGETVYRDTRISGDTNKILVSNPLSKDYFSGKTFLCLGDSLTNGTGVEKDERYHALMGVELGSTIKAGGVSGGVLCTGGHLPERFQYMTAEYLTKNNIDVVTIFLGVNDWGNGVINGIFQGKLKYDENATYYGLGEFGTDDTTTIYGAAKMYCERINEIKATEGCEDIQFVFATPVITSWNNSTTSKRDWNQDKVNIFGYTLRQYCTAIMEVCAYYEIPALDLNMYSGMYYHSETDNNVEYFGGDGIHPGANGHQMMADAFVEFLLEGYSYEERKVDDCGHSYESTVTEPTCIEGGYTTYRCPECYYSYISDYTEATGHSYENGICVYCGEREYPIGDINLDGSVDVKDAYYARLVAAKLIVPTDEQISLGDVDLDGKITAIDANIIRKFVVGVLKNLPV